MSDEKFIVFEVVRQRIDEIGGSGTMPVTGLFLSRIKATGAAIEYLRVNHPNAKWNRQRKAWLFKDGYPDRPPPSRLRYPLHCIFVLPREVTA